MRPTSERRPDNLPELLYLLANDPAELAEALVGLRAADVAEALRDLPSDAAAKVMAALPFDLAVQVFDEPELTHHRCEIVNRMHEERAAPLVDAMSADQQADLFRELRETDRRRLLKLVDEPTRRALELLLRYAPDTAGGIMTTEAVTIPVSWTVQEALEYVAKVGRTKETVYAIYCLEPDDHRLVHVVSLRDLMVAEDKTQEVNEIGNRRKPLAVRPGTDREEVARLISKYNLLALPVID